MRLSQLLTNAHLSPVPALCDREITRIVCNSADAGKDTLFVCIRGFRIDGHDYASECYDRGCRAFLSERPLDLPPDCTVVRCDNTRRALAEVSHAFYGFPSEQLRVIGITGTKGKTSVAHILMKILNDNGIPAAVIGTTGVDSPCYRAETDNTTPESVDLARFLSELLARGVRVAILEVSSQALYLERVFGIRFYATCFTNLSPDHIGESEHPSFAHYLHCKRKLFTEYPARYAVFNAADPYFEAVSDGCLSETRTVGLNASDFFASECVSSLSDGLPGVSFVLRRGGKKIPAFLSMPGKFNVSNAVCAVALAETLGVPPERSVLSLSRVSVPGRFELFRAENGALFVIDYAHNAVSIENVLRTLRSFCRKKLFCVVGSVGGRTTLRRAAIGKAVSTLCDEVILTSDNPDYEDPTAICEEIRAAFVWEIPCRIIEDRAEAIRFAAATARKGDVVLLAGKGHERYQLVRGEKRPFSERAVLEDCCKAAGPCS